MEENMTVREVIEATAKLLEELEIPIYMIEKIGNKIRGAAWNLRQCIAAIDEAGRRNKADEQPEIAETQTFGANGRND